MSNSVAGFALIPLLIGMALFAILLSLVLTQFSFLDQLLVRTELHALYATIYYAQQVAQLRGQTCAIVCDTHTNQYRCDNRTRVLPRSVIFGVKTGVCGPPGGAYRPVTEPITFKNRCIQATAHGIINAGTLYLINTGKQYQYALSSAVSQVSYIRCYRHDTEWVQIR